VIKSWIFELFAAPHELADKFDPAASKRFFDDYLDLWTSAEACGFDGIFFSEHHFGLSYSPSPNLLIATIAERTKTIRLGVMGMVPPYHTPWQLAEEIGMLDHLTGGRLEIGTAMGIPQEMAQVGIDPEEARARNDEAVEIIDKALAAPVISHHGRFWNFDDLRLTPRPLQQPEPPKWVTVISTSSARKAARRGAKISTGFHPLAKVIEIFDAYRDEAAKCGRKAGPEDLCLRRQVMMRDDPAALEAWRRIYRERIKVDPRADVPGRAAILDTPTQHAFAIGDDEFIGGTSSAIADEIIAQLCRAGAGNVAVIFDRSAGPATLKGWYREFGAEVIPRLRTAEV
jgi:alkanesulfonate monooxygenase SsuD/methylene tetrahydromethanopterin reductase-like flavin-dependent oxidoreductase (luciferase family)